MDLEKLQGRLLQIEDDLKVQHKQLEQIVANINLLNGGKMECEHWIANYKDDVKLNGCVLTEESTEQAVVLN